MVSELLFLVRRIIDALEAMYVVALMSVLVAISIIVFFIARMGWSFYRLRGRHAGSVSWRSETGPSSGFAQHTGPLRAH